MLPPVSESIAPIRDVQSFLAPFDAVVITGGAFDIHPRYYGESPRGRLDTPDHGRTEQELALIRACIDLNKPMLGVCGGMQAMAVATGGSLFQDIEAEVQGALAHEQPTDPTEAWHDITLSAGVLPRHMGETIRTNSTHHQAVKDPGRMEIVGRAPDGVIEAIELTDLSFCLGVQWHPELGDDTPYRLLLESAQTRRH